MGIIKIPARLSVATKPCDYCNSATAVLFCRPDAAFMCISCDEKVHKITDKHARVWVCEVCEQAPAVVTCKADAAALCATCDREIHSVNPLASRHERVPLIPFYDSAKITVIKSTGVTEGGDNIFAAPVDGHGDKIDTCIDLNGYIPDSWISRDRIFTSKIQTDLKAVDFSFSDSNQFLDFDNYQIPLSQHYTDSLVPVQAKIKPPVLVQLSHDHLTGNRFEIDFTRSNISSYNNSSYTTPSLSHSVSSSSMDVGVGVVPDGSSISDTSYTFMNPTVDLSGNQGSKIVEMDREARVLRYKEKRKNRKFEKTIRYASRKAYAETRPRIKGRFAKRTDSEPDMDRIFGVGASSFAVDARYAVVPSF